MKRFIGIIAFFLLPLCAYTQKVDLNIIKDLEWAKWHFETIEYQNAYTIVSGFFIPGKGGCWVNSSFKEKLIANGREYAIIETTLPVNNEEFHFTTYTEGDTISFEYRFEPILKLETDVELLSENISFRSGKCNIHVLENLEKRYKIYTNRMNYLLSNSEQERLFRYLSLYSKNLVEMNKDSVRLARKILNEVYDPRMIIINSTPQDINSNLDFISQIHYGITGKQISKRESKQLKELCNYAYKMYWNSELHNYEYICINKNRIDEIFYKEEVNSRLYNSIQYIIQEAKDSLHLKHTNNFELNETLRKYGKISPEYLNVLVDVANEQVELDNSVSIKSDSLWKEVEIIANNLYGDSSRIYIESLIYRANAEYKKKSYEKAISLYSKIELLKKKYNNIWQRDYSNKYKKRSEIDNSVTAFKKLFYYPKWALANYFCGNYLEARRLDPGNIYYYLKNMPKKELQDTCSFLYRNNVDQLVYMINAPSALPYSYGDLYSDSWDFLYNDALLEIIPFIAMRTKDPHLIELALNGILISKGYKLYAENYLREKLLSQRDSIGYNMYKQLCGYLKKINRESESHIRKQEEYILGKSIIELKKKLSKHLKSKPIETNDFMISWDKIKSRLMPTDIAIEFLEVPIWPTDSVAYIAISYKKCYEYPKLTILKQGEGKDIFPIDNEEDILSVLEEVWEPLKEEIQDVQNIYFSPFGQLHTLPLENYNFEKNFYRLTSTKELLKSQKSNSMIKQCALYGGLQYNTKLSNLNTHYKRRNENYRGSLNDISIETGMEVDSIAYYLSKKNIEYSIFKGYEGTEESFKSLSYSDVEIIHLSTHGFYWTNSQLKHKDNKSKDYSFMRIGQITNDDEDKAMVRSALLFSDSQNTLNGENRISKEDAVLTAKEIAALYFPKLELVVLSACQTGLGDIDYSEGVLGIQRGFKRAGAKSILMTLRPVNDKATRLFMVEFYKQLLNGNSKMSAFKSAQKYLINYMEEGEKIYNKQEYWTPFVLLDAN